MSLRILVVDDQPDIRRLLEMVLDLDGHTVIEADNGLTGLEKLRTERPDVVLLDIRMPVMDGWGFLEAASNEGLLDGTTTVAVSAHADKKTVERALSSGCSSYIDKPFTPAQILAAAREWEQMAESRRP